jgi:hypothetical protein
VGDGGFISAAVEATDSDEQAMIDRYVDALSSGGTPGCILRWSGNVTEPDGFLLETGIGDGGYATYVGRDARGQITSVVHDGGHCSGRSAGCRVPRLVILEDATRVVRRTFRTMCILSASTFLLACSPTSDETPATSDETSAMTAGVWNVLKARYAMTDGVWIEKHSASSCRITKGP